MPIDADAAAGSGSARARDERQRQRQNGGKARVSASTIENGGKTAERMAGNPRGIQISSASTAAHKQCKHEIKGGRREERE